MTPVGPRLLIALRVFIFLCSVSSSIQSFSQDLIITEVTGSTSFTRYTNFSLSVTVKNNGIVPTYSSTWVNFYLSVDNSTTTDNSEYVGDAYVENLVADEQRLIVSRKREITLPPGNYYLIAKIDQYNSVQETDNSNNTIVIAGYAITDSDVDFVFTSLTSNKNTQTVHQPVQIDYTLANSGTTNTEGNVTSKFYISTDTEADAADIEVTSDLQYLDNKADVASAQLTFDVPAVTPGNYYIVGKLDTGGKYAETNEGNNTFAIPITITASDIDLEIPLGVEYTKPNPYHSSYPWEPEFDIVKLPMARWRLLEEPLYNDHMFELDIEIILENNGTTGFHRFNYDLFLSSDEFLDPDDRNISSHDQLESSIEFVGNDSVRMNLNFTDYFGPWPPGEYYVIVKLNSDNSLAETNYSNNIAVSTNKIKLEYPRIDLTNIEFIGSYTDVDKDINLSLSFDTQYNANFVQYRWSDDDYHSYPSYTYDLHEEYHLTFINRETGYYYSTQYDFHNSFHQYLTFGTSDDPVQFERDWSLTLNDPLPAGQYDVSIGCGRPCWINAWDKMPILLTVASTQPPPLHQLSGNIKGEDGPPISKGKLFLYQKKDNGRVQFINKVTPTTTSTYSFDLDFRQHTLYFIPDPTQYPNYVPTILGKTVTLQESNFLTIDQNTIRDFEILRVQPLAAGNKSISGNVYVNNVSAAASFFAATATVTEPIPVTLLNDAGDPVAVTQTDLDGFYEFKNLPSDNYQLVVALELDDPAAMPEPFNVDVTTDSKEVIFDLTTPSAPSISVRKKQIITFTAPHELTYGDSPLILNASSTSGLPVSYTTDNSSIVSLTNNVLTVLKPGTVKLTASHDGNSDYASAEEEITVTVKKALLNVTASDVTLYYGDANPLFSVSYSGFKNNETAAVIDTQPQVTTTATSTSKPGTYELEVKGGIDNNYELKYTKGILTISKAPLTVTAFNASRYYGDANPTFAIGYTGFKNKETDAVIDTHPKASTEATSTSDAGTYDILASGGSDDNYELKYKAGKLTVAKAPLFVTVIDATVPYNAAQPQFKASYTGFKNNETVSVLDTPPTFSSPTLTNAIAGTVHEVIASDGEDVNYAFNYKNGKVTVVKGDLYVRADDKTRKYLEPNPALTFAYSGLKSGEDVPSSGVVLPSVSTDATQNSDAGYYAITLTGGSGGTNYNLIPAGGLLTIQKLDQTISFDLAVTQISFEASPLMLTAESSAGLPVRFVVTEGKDIASLESDGTTLGWSGKTGKVTVTARQNGNVNYKEASDVSRSFNVLPPDDLVLGIETPADEILSAAPNPARSEVVVRSSAENIETVLLYNNLGSVIYIRHEINEKEHHIDLSDVASGIYIVRIVAGKNQKTVSLAVSK